MSEKFDFDERHPRRSAWVEMLGVVSEFATASEVEVRRADHKFEDGLPQQYPLALEATEDGVQELPLAS